MKKSANPAAIIGGILSIVVALSWGAVNLAYGDMLAEDAAQMIQFMLPPFLFLVLAVFLFIGKPRAGVPIVMTILLLCTLLARGVAGFSTHTLKLFILDGKLYNIRGLNRLFMGLWNPLYLLALLAFVVLGFLMVSGRGRMLWFLPPALATLSSLMVISILLGQMELNEGDFHLPFTILSEVVRTAALWCAARFMAGPGPVMAASGGGSYACAGEGGAYAPYRAEGYVDLMSCALLLIFTLGIYHLVWIYRTTRYLNRVEGAPSRNPTTKLLLCMFIPFYTIYWTYQSAQRVDALARSRGLYAELTAPCVLLSIFAGIVPPLLMQNTINAVSQTEAPGAAAPAAEEAQPTPAAAAAPAAGKSEEDVIEALKRYKELLDQGVITQEEFDRKKARLLGQ